MDRESYLLGPFREHADFLREYTRRGIENHRKGGVALRVTDENGAPLPGAAVEVCQKTHDFFYGANLFMLDEFETAEKNAAFRKAFPQYFNFATLPFYWADLEPQEGKPRFYKDSPRVYRRPAPDLCLEYCEENGIMPKAHCLNYDLHTPLWLTERSAQAQWERLEKRFSELSRRYAGRIPGWEVTNEHFWGDHRSRMYEDDRFVERSFALAEKYFPGNELIINEAASMFSDPFIGDRDKYLMLTQRAISRGSRIDAVGFQYHIFTTPEKEADLCGRMLDPIKQIRVLETFARELKRPMQITEITLPCMDPYSREAEDLQAELLRQLYTLWFSVPDMEAIIYWNPVDGYAYKAEPGDFSAGENRYAGGLMHFDLTPKPAAEMIRTLFTKTWHTEDTLTAGPNGEVRLRGFYGAYEARITVNGKTFISPFRIRRGEENQTMCLSVPRKE